MIETVIIGSDLQLKESLISKFETIFPNQFSIETHLGFHQLSSQKSNPELVLFEIDPLSTPSSYPVEIQAFQDSCIEIIGINTEKTNNTIFPFETIDNSIDDYSFSLKILATKKLISLNNKIINRLDNLESSLKINQIERIAFPCKEGSVFYSINSICYFEADGNYTLIHLEEGGTQIVTKQLKVIERGLMQEHFFRVHQSYLININYIFKYCKSNNAFVIMTNGKKINVSRSKKSDLAKFINIF